MDISWWYQRTRTIFLKFLICKWVVHSPAPHEPLWGLYFCQVLIFNYEQSFLQYISAPAKRLKVLHPNWVRTIKVRTINHLKQSHTFTCKLSHFINTQFNLNLCTFLENYNLYSKCKKNYNQNLEVQGFYSYRNLKYQAKKWISRTQFCINIHEPQLILILMFLLFAMSGHYDMQDLEL